MTAQQYIDKEISRLHYITQPVEGATYPEMVKQACASGVDWVQLRLKSVTEKEWNKIAKEVQHVCQRYNAKLIINDNVVIAREIDAAGVHLGQDDMHPAKAREYLGETAIIGGTAHTMQEVEQMVEAGVDYIGLGPFRYTKTKKRLRPILGLQGIQDITEQCRTNGLDIPVIAIGGIRPADIRMIMKTGVHGVAVSSAISKSDDRSNAVRQFITQIKLTTHDKTIANSG